MNEEERRKYEAFQYWIQTNTEKGVTTIPDTLCLFVVNLIKSLQKENEKLKNKLLDTLEGKKVIEEETPQYIKENYILKEKIKDKIEEIQEEGYWLFTTDRDSDKCVEVLQQLLGKE